MRNSILLRKRWIWYSTKNIKGKRRSECGGQTNVEFLPYGHLVPWRWRSVDGFRRIHTGVVKRPHLQIPDCDNHERQTCRDSTFRFQIVMLYDCCITFTFTFHPSHLIMLALHALLFRTGSIEKSNHLKMSVFKSTVNPVILNLNLIVIVESVKFSASCCSYLTLFHRHLLDAAKSCWSSGRMCSGLFANIQITTSRPRVCLTINTCCQIATYFKIQIQIDTDKEAHERQVFEAWAGILFG